MKLGLTKKAIEERRNGIGGSDAGKIMAGEWYDLWMDKTGRKPPEDLSKVLPVQMGNATEEFNAHWYTLMIGHKIIQRGTAVVSKEHPFMRVTLDGVIPEIGAVWQAKHVSGRQPIEELVVRYTPQVTHEMIVVGMKKAILSVFLGTDRFEAVEIPLDEFYAETLIERETAFWKHVTSDTPPKDGAPVVPPVAPEKFRTVSMEGNNRWAMFAGDWLTNEQPMKLFTAAQAGLKALIEPDVGEASGHGIIIKRDKRGLAIKRMA